MPTRHRDSLRAAAAASALAALHLPAEALAANAREQRAKLLARPERRSPVEAAGSDGPSPAAGLEPP